MRPQNRIDWSRIFGWYQVAILSIGLFVCGGGGLVSIIVFCFVVLDLIGAINMPYPRWSIFAVIFLAGLSFGLFGVILSGVRSKLRQLRER